MALFIFFLIPPGSNWGDALYSVPETRQDLCIVILRISLLHFLAIWFFTESGRWRYVILPTFTLLSFQVFQMIVLLLRLDFGGVLIGLSVASNNILLLFASWQVGYYKFSLQQKLHLNSVNLPMINDLQKELTEFRRIYQKLKDVKLEESTLSELIAEFTRQSSRMNLIRTFSHDAPVSGMRRRTGIVVSLIMILLPVAVILQKVIKVSAASIPFQELLMTPSFYRPEVQSEWFLFNLSMVLPMSIWFFISKHWWKYVILVPLTIFLFQYSELLVNQDGITNTSEIVFILPLMLLILGKMLIISFKVNQYVAVREFYHLIEVSLNKKLINFTLKKKRNHLLHEEFCRLKHEGEGLALEDYLQELESLKYRIREWEE
ncbi:hypothetical protein DMZ48_05605 [Robertkochia solimangrovi]|nr:hypothetical protein DMZ48_05605 [Robertkochia solimangrovi]